MAKQLSTSGRGRARAGLAPFRLRALAQIELRRSAGTRILATLFMVAVPLVYGWNQMARTFSRDHLDVYFEFFTSPIILVLPAFAALIGGSSLFAELGNRFVANTRTRLPVHVYLATKLAVGGGLSFLAFFAMAFATFAAAFWVWPAIGDVNVDPTAYGMTTTEAALDASRRTTFSQLLTISDTLFGAVYSFWFGFCGFVYAAATILMLVVVHNRAIAVAIPLMLYLSQTVVAALLGVPSFGLLYSAVPFGMSQSDIILGMLPTILLLVAVAAGWVAMFLNARHTRRLS